MTGSKTKLSSSTTVSRYRELVKNGDKATLSKFIIERFDERYFRPVETSDNKHGFALMTIACLVIETLESFYQGRSDTKGKARQMFEEFFKRDKRFEIFQSEDNWFFRDIRCGILHQAETRGGWKISRCGSMLDKRNKIINATAFLRQLRKSVESYASELQKNEVLWESFCKKMDAICVNCQPAS